MSTTTSTPATCPTLTDRQKQIVRLVADGLTNAEIADTLDVSPHTIRTTLYKLSKRCGADSRTHLVSLAVASHQIDISGTRPAARR